MNTNQRLVSWTLDNPIFARPFQITVDASLTLKVHYYVFLLFQTRKRSKKRRGGARGLSMDQEDAFYGILNQRIIIIVIIIIIILYYNT